MKAMASKLFSPFKSHPLIACFILLLFTPPILPVVMFFWPLIVSTALGVFAVISFGQQVEHKASAAENVVCTDTVAFRAQEEKISNVLMIGNQEVTWLEWLHNEDMQTSELSMSAVWDADKCYAPFTASEAIADALASEANTDNVYACSSIVEEETGGGSLVSTAENETMAIWLTPTGFDGISVDAIALTDGDQDETKKNALSLIAEDETKRNELGMTVEDETNRNGLGSSVKHDEDMDATKMSAHILTAEDEAKANALHTTAKDVTKHFGCDGRNAAGSHFRYALSSSAKDVTAEDMRKRNENSIVENGTDVNALACVVGESQMSIDELGLTGNSIVENGTDVNALACVVGESQMSIDELGLTGKSEGMVNTGIASVHMTTVISSLGLRFFEKNKTKDCAFTSEGEGVDRLNALLATSEAESRVNVPELSSPNIPVSVMLERKAAEGNEMQHIDDQDQEERALKQMDAQGPRWDVNDGEEGQSSLRFSFFHNGCFIPTLMKHEEADYSQASKNISPADVALHM